MTPPAIGISEEENLASDGDIHKVYLTFEDGPSDNTEEILDILAQYDVKATFFVVGKEDEESKALYQRIVDEGHTLGMHSYSNKYSQIYQSDEAFEEDFERLRDELYQVTGVNSIYYRFPGGSSNQISNVPMSDFIHYLNEKGVIYYDWNISAGDAASNAYSSEEIVANVMDDVVKYKTSVVLLHDASDKSTTVDALAPLIEALNEMGAEILPIDEDTSVIQYVKPVEYLDSLGVLDGGLIAAHCVHLTDGDRRILQCILQYGGGGEKQTEHQEQEQHYGEFLVAEYLRGYIRMPYGSHPVDVYQQGHYGYYDAGANLHAVQPVVKVSIDTDKNNREQHGCP